jgi:uncharacterized protein YbgA (DUF1722 family)/uncharacterized protein YbbK (DUF523 family)
MRSAGDVPLRLGVSACLLGQRVRHDAGHKHDPFLTEVLGAFVEWVPVCPEVELGLGVPRPTIRLERSDDAIRLVSPRSGDDLTAPMRAFAASRVEELEARDLSGYVFKKDSPSCGMERVRVWTSGADRAPARDGRGAFAAMLMERMPLLPVEEEGRLRDPRLRENFVERVFAYRRLRDLFGARWRLADLVRFHTIHKLQLLAHDPPAYASLGRIVGRGRGVRRAELAERYSRDFMAALARVPTVRRHVNVLQHALGHLRARLDTTSRADIAERIQEYRRGLAPLIVPIALIRHQVRTHAVAYLDGQTYLVPAPRELIARTQ